MVVATTGLLFAAVARMAWLSALGGYAAFVTVWLSPVWLGMAYDLIALRLIHPAYAAGLTLLLVSALRYYAVDSIWWHDIAERLVRLVS